MTFKQCKDFLAHSFKLQKSSKKAQKSSKKQTPTSCRHSTAKSCQREQGMNKIILIYFYLFLIPKTQEIFHFIIYVINILYYITKFKFNGSIINFNNYSASAIKTNILFWVLFNENQKKPLCTRKKYKQFIFVQNNFFASHLRKKYYSNY